MNSVIEEKLELCRKRLQRKAEAKKEEYFSRENTEERLSNLINLKRLKSDFQDIRADIGRKKIPYGFMFSVPISKEKYGDVNALFMLSGCTGNADTTLKVRVGFDSGIVTSYEVVGSQHLKNVVYDIAERWPDIKKDLSEEYERYLVRNKIIKK